MFNEFFNSDTRRFRDFYERVISPRGEGDCIVSVSCFESTILEDEIYSIEFIGTLFIECYTGLTKFSMYFEWNNRV